MLACKPRDRKGIIEGKEGIGLRSLQPKKDAVQLMKEVNKEEWIQVYKNILSNADAHAWSAISGDLIIGQLDIYTIVAGELGKHFPARSNDAVLQYRIHQPATSLMHREILWLFMQYYFNHPSTELLYGQAEIYENKTCRLYENAGFVFQQNTMLGNQAISLYLMTRYRFNEERKKI